MNCGKNDASFIAILEKGYGFYKSIGTQRITVQRIGPVAIDQRHAMAKVFYRANYRKTSGQLVSVDFDVTYFVAEDNDRPRIFSFVAGDEMAIYGQYGLID